MKKLFFWALLFTTGIAGAQTLNDKGLYIDSDGELFNGTLRVNEAVKSEFTVKNGVIAGAATYYYDSGKVMETGVFNNGRKDDKWIRYNENGSIGAIAFYNFGKKTGTWVVFDESGKKRFEMNYTDGQKTGVWTNWDENGAVVESKDYSKVN